MHVSRLSALVMVTAAAVVGGAARQATPAGATRPSTGTAVQDDRPPNLIVIFADDLGYGDLGSYGHPTVRTPRLDQMAAEGQRWTSFYASASVCTPSRAGLLTGRLAVRSGMAGEHVSGRRVLFPDSSGGLPQAEVTIAELLKSRGYATAAIGKWHLGHLPQHLPTTQGFDSYFGIPYSNDMDQTGSGLDGPARRARMFEPRIEFFNVPLMRGTAIVERPADQRTLTGRYTDEAVAFIRAHRDAPFFLYLAHAMPHMPLFRGESFVGRSQRGVYGDVIEELDASTGRILDAVRELGLEGRTLVVFTSDNGPWAVYEEQGGSAGPLRGAKGGTYEGGMRVPAIFWGKGLVAPGVVTALGSTLDLWPTAAALSGAGLEPAGPLDGYDVSAVLRRGAAVASPRQEMWFYRGATLYAVRRGAYKAHLLTRGEYTPDPPVTHDRWQLYDLDQDPAEQWEIGGDHPQVLDEMRTLVARHRATLETPPSLLEGRVP